MESSEYQRRARGLNGTPLVLLVGRNLNREQAEFSTVEQAAEALERTAERHGPSIVNPRRQFDEAELVERADQSGYHELCSDS